MFKGVALQGYVSLGAYLAYVGGAIIVWWMRKDTYPCWHKMIFRGFYTTDRCKRKFASI